MNNQKSNNLKHQSKRYLERIRHRYVFDSASEIDRQQAEKAQAKSGEKATPKNERPPLRVDVRRDWVAVIISASTLLLLTITVIYSHFQWREADRTAKASVCATRISEDALRLSRQEFVSSQAALLQPTVHYTFSPSGGRFIQVDLVNSGHIAATRVNGEIVFSRSGAGRPKLVKITDTSVSSQSPSPTYQTGFITRTIVLRDSPTDQQLAEDHARVTIKIMYWNGLEQTTGAFCYVLIKASPYEERYDWTDCENQEAFQQK